MSRSDRIVVAAAGGAVLLALAAVAVLLLPPDGEHDDSTALLVATPPVAGESAPALTASAGAASVVVDVAGAVLRPGLVELAAGARVGDAIAAAGGYATDADLDAATRSLNLAQHLGDGEQVRVPRIGESVAVSAGGSAGGEGSGPGAPMAGGGAAAGPGSGLVNLNTATPEELEALPGIGPVTVQKIVAARQERPFASLEDAQQRGVIHRGQLEDIRELATAG